MVGQLTCGLMCSRSYGHSTWEMHQGPYYFGIHYEDCLCLRCLGMTIDDVPADVIQELTPELDRLFRVAHCRPGCHSCFKKIEVGSKFQLLSLNGTDEMLCNVCTSEDLERKHTKDLAAKKQRDAEYLADQQSRRARGHSGYSRPSKVQ